MHGLTDNKHLWLLIAIVVGVHGLLLMHDWTNPEALFKGDRADGRMGKIQYLLGLEDRPNAFQGAFTEQGTLSDGAAQSATGYWRTSGRTLYGPDGRPTALRGWRIGGKQADGPLTEGFFRNLVNQGVSGNHVAFEIWWSSRWGPSEPTPSRSGTYRTEKVANLLTSMRNAVRAGLWVVPSFRVSWDQAYAADNLANDGLGAKPWSGWADHIMLIHNDTVTTGGSDYGKYRDRFFVWLDWLIPQIQADREINSAIAFWEMWHLPFHRHTTETDSDRDDYLDTTPGTGFAKLLLDKFREHETEKLLAFSFRAASILTRAKDHDWTPLGDSNIAYITGGYGWHDLLIKDPPDTGKTWPVDSTQPKWNATDGEFEFITFGAAKNIAFISQEGPGLHPNLRRKPIGADQKAFLNGLFDLYNEHANGWAFHGLKSDTPQPELESSDEFGGYFRQALNGAKP